MTALRPLQRLARSVHRWARRQMLRARIAQMDMALTQPERLANTDRITQALWAAQAAALRCELAALERQA